MKRIVSLTLVIAMLLSVVCGCKNTATVSDDGEYITRASWVETVGQHFGMIEYLSDTPYFEDVTGDSEIFNYVQSCYEWGAISTDSDKFKPDDIATLGFAVCSSVMIIKSGEEGLTNDDLLDFAVENQLITEDERKNSLNKGITGQRASELLVITDAIYLTENMEIINELKVAEDIKDYGEETEKITYVSENEYVIDSSIAETLSKDTVLTVPGNDGINEEIAVKVADMKENEDGTYTVTTVQPEFEEVVQELNLQGTRYVSYKNFEPVEGVKVVPLENTGSTVSFKGIPNPTASNMLNVVTKDKDGNIVQLGSDGDESSFKLEVTLNSDKQIKASAEAEYNGNGFKLGFADDGSFSVETKNELGMEGVVEYEVPDEEDLEDLAEFTEAAGVDLNQMLEGDAISTIEDFKAGILDREDLESTLKKPEIKNSLKEKGQFDSGWEITGAVEIKNLAVTPDIKFGKTFWGGTNYLDFKKASVRVTGEISNTLTVKGELSFDKEIGRVVIPTQVPSLTINIIFYVYVDLNGEITIKTKLNIDNKIECKKGSAPKSTNDTTMENSIEAKLEIEGGIAAGVAIYLLGFDVFSLRLKGGVGADVSCEYTKKHSLEQIDNNLIYTEEYKLYPDGGFYGPLISIDVNETDGNILGKLGLKAELKIVSKDTIKDSYDEYGKPKFGFYIPFFKDFEDGIDVMKITYTISLLEEEFEGSEGEYLMIDKLALDMALGDKAYLYVDNCPEGYEISELKWSSDDTSVVTVDNGKVTAVGEGNAVITVATKDGLHSITCAVIVNE